MHKTSNLVSTQGKSHTELEDEIPAGTFYHSLPVEEVEELLLKQLPIIRKDQYFNVALAGRMNKQAGTRTCFQASKWAPYPKGLPVVIKVDKATLELAQRSKRAAYNAERGYGTNNDRWLMLSIPDAESHNLVQLMDMFDLDAKGSSIPVLVEKEFRDSRSLESMVRELRSYLSPDMATSHPLCQGTFEGIFSQIISGIRYFNNVVGAYHRDIKPSNILVNRKGEVRITDFALAKRKLDLEKTDYGPFASVGSHFTSNPFLFESLTKDFSEYDDRSEIYSIGQTAFFALTERNMFDCNPLTGISRVVRTGESLMSGNQLDKDKFARAARSELKYHLQGHRYSKFIEQCILAPLEK